MKARREKLAVNARELWIEDTRMFQRIAKVSVTSAEELGEEWDKMKVSQKVFNSEHARTHRVIQDMAVRAGKARKS